MLDTLSAWVAAVWTALALFVASNVEPQAGVWVAAVSGGLLSGMVGIDRPFLRRAAHFGLGVFVGIFSSQIILEVISLKTPQSRVAVAFFCALFAEKIVAGIHNGSILAAIWPGRRGK
jgi:hypothetical protein